MASISTGAEEVGVPRKIKFENDASSVAEPTTVTEQSLPRGGSYYGAGA